MEVRVLLSALKMMIIISLARTTPVKRLKLLTFLIDLKVLSGHYMEVRVLLSALTVIIVSLTRMPPGKRPFRFILVFANNASQLLNTGYHEKV
jgi:hypothetical protein